MSAAEPTETPGFRIKGWHVFAGVAAFFAVIMAVDGAFTVIALKTFPGQVSVTPYEDGLLYNRRIAQLRAQEALGWHAAAAAEPGQVAMEFVDTAGRPLSGLEVKGRLARPATEAGQVALTFAEAAPGRYVAPAGRINGAWDLTAEARDRNGAVFAAERRLTWP